MADLTPRHVIAKALNPHCLHDNILTCPCEPSPVACRDADTVIAALEAAGYGVEALIDPDAGPWTTMLRKPANRPGPVIQATDSDEQFEAGEDL